MPGERIFIFAKVRIPLARRDADDCLCYFKADAVHCLTRLLVPREVCTCCSAEQVTDGSNLPGIGRACARTATIMTPVNVISTLMLLRTTSSSLVSSSSDLNANVHIYSFPAELLNVCPATTTTATKVSSETIHKSDSNDLAERTDRVIQIPWSRCTWRRGPRCCSSGFRKTASSPQR